MVMKLRMTGEPADLDRLVDDLRAAGYQVTQSRKDYARDDSFGVARYVEARRPVTTVDAERVADPAPIDDHLSAPAARREHRPGRRQPRVRAGDQRHALPPSRR